MKTKFSKTKFSKTITIVLIAAVTFSSAMPAFASIPFPENDAGEQSVPKVINNENVVPSTRTDLEKKIDAFTKAYTSNEKNFSREKYEKAQNFIDSIEIIELSRKDLLERTTNSFFESNESRLRAGNYIETVLNLDEGLSDAEAVASIVYATESKLASTLAYPNDAYKEDAYRHFHWNFSMADAWGQYKARTVGNNHEWGLVLLTPIMNYHQERYDYYISIGYNDEVSAQKALLDITNYICELKYYTVQLCEGSLANFKTLFDNGNIMDLHNNCYGRAAASSYSAPIDAFVDAWNSGDLIKHPDLVTNTNYNNVWSWDWYTY